MIQGKAHKTLVGLLAMRLEADHERQGGCGLVGAQIGPPQGIQVSCRAATADFRQR